MLWIDHAISIDPHPIEILNDFSIINNQEGENLLSNNCIVEHFESAYQYYGK
jgi:hypothetical protein